MFKKLYLGAIILTLILTLLVPVQIQAKGDAPAKVTPFSASAYVYVADGGTSTYAQHGNLIYEHQVGEIVTGQILAVNGWQALNGGTITITHNADSIANIKAGTFEALASGKITLVLNTGDVCEASYKAVISGKFTISSTGKIAYTVVKDLAEWNFISGTEGHGVANATLYPTTLGGLPTYGGIMKLTGTHK